MPRTSVRSRPAWTRALLAATGALVLAFPRPCAAAFQFDSAFERLPSVATAWRMAATDIDGDGVTDLVVAGATSQLTVHRGRSAGGFAPAAPLVSVSGVVADFAVGDLDGDGDPDLVVADGSKTAWSMLGNGDGTFQSPRAFLSLFTCRSLTLADLDRDGRLDVVAVAWLAPLYTMRGLGDGRFQLVSIVTLLGPPMSSAVADFDGDALPDVLVGYSFYGGPGEIRALYFHRGLPGLALAAPVLCVDAIAAARIRTADLDEDGLADAMVMHGGGLALLFGVRGAAPTTRVDLAVSSAVESRAADLDGDGHPELAVSALGEPIDGIAIFKRGAGRSFARVTDFAAGHSPGDMAFVDVDRDGRLDAIATNDATSSLAVIRAREVLRYGAQAEVATGPHAWDLATGDIDRDGRQDVVVALANHPSHQLETHLGVGDGSFRAPLTATGSYYLKRVELGDVNGDGELDIVAASVFYEWVQAHLGDGAGHFAPGTAQSMPGLGTMSFRMDVALGDFDEDGKDDAVAAADAGLYLVRGAAVTGLGAPVKLGMQAKCVVTADLDRDGHRDLVVTNSMRDGEWGSQVYVYMGHGDGTFTLLPTFYAGYKPFAMVARDLTGDGTPDLAVANWGDRSIAVFRGVGDGTFVSTVTIANVSATSIAVADCDGDLRPDLLAGVPAVSGIQLWPGLGDGTFGTPETFGCRNSPDVLKCADLDADGLPDLLVGHLDGRAFDVHLNRAEGTPTPALVSLVEARVEGGQVRIVWSSVSPLLATAVVQRGVRGVWQDAGRVRADGADRLVFEEEVAAGEYDYRLRVADGGRILTLGDVHVVVGVARRLALASCAWDDDASAFQIVMSIPGTAAAHLAVVDLMGRVIARREVTPNGAATQRVLVSSERPRASGLYWIRLEQAGRAVSGKAMVLR